MLDIINKLYSLTFVFTTLVIVRNVFFLIRSLRLEEKFKIDNPGLITLGLSISYFLTSIIHYLI